MIGVEGPSFEALKFHNRTQVLGIHYIKKNLPETQIAPETALLEYDFPFERANFQVTVLGSVYAMSTQKNNIGVVSVPFFPQRIRNKNPFFFFRG